MMLYVWESGAGSRNKVKTKQLRDSLHNQIEKFTFQEEVWGEKQLHYTIFTMELSKINPKLKMTEIKHSPDQFCPPQ